MKNRPLLNLFDVAGILMLVIFFCGFLAAFGSKVVTWGAVLVLVVLFGGAVYFAKKGAS